MVVKPTQSNSREWRRQFQPLLAKFQARAKKHPISEKQVTEEVRVVRTQRRTHKRQGVPDEYDLHRTDSE
jgi:membrane-bound lytic murein transglycosylase B